MPRSNTGGGAGQKRRIRTQRRSIDATTCIVGRNRSKKPAPANWRELLVEAVVAFCDKPSDRYIKNHDITGRAIPRPGVHIALGSLPTGMIEFTLDSRGYARHQLNAIEQALRHCDVTNWPVPKPSARVGKGKECFVNTGLLLSDNLLGNNEHLFNPFRLKNVPEINWMHLEAYTAKRGQAEYLGIKTTCGEPCPCRRTLPDLWPLGWEMQY
jgi:hypothetical protein